MRRHDNAGQERTEKRVDTHDFSHERGCEKEHQDTGGDSFAERTFSQSSVTDPTWHERLDPEKHEKDEHYHKTDTQEGSSQAAGLHDRYHKGQYAPGGDIVTGGARDRGAA